MALKIFILKNTIPPRKISQYEINELKRKWKEESAQQWEKVMKRNEDLECLHVVFKKTIDDEVVAREAYKKQIEEKVDARSTQKEGRGQ